MFQSAPAIAGGRCPTIRGSGEGFASFNPRPPLLAGDAAASCAPHPHAGVSIRARHCWRAMLGWKKCRDGVIVFQSAPAIAGGRCCRQVRRPSTPTSFNPRPPLLAGDARAGVSGFGPSHVSIRARHCWRAMPRGPSSSRTGRGFNPRPPLLAGDAGGDAKIIQGSAVSIRARHCWRAMPLID